jgi:hypothetical protein
MSPRTPKKSGRAPRPRRPAPSSLVAVELGSAFPSWVASAASNGEFRVLSQRDQESTEAFHVRVMTLAGEVLLGTDGSRRIVFACNERTDENMLASRRAVIRALLALVPAPRAPRVVLAADARSSTHLRQALFDLCTEIPETGTTVRVDDDPASRPRTLRPSVANVA